MIKSKFDDFQDSEIDPKSEWLWRYKKVIFSSILDPLWQKKNCFTISYSPRHTAPDHHETRRDQIMHTNHSRNETFLKCVSQQFISRAANIRKEVKKSLRKTIINEMCVVDEERRSSSLFKFTIFFFFAKLLLVIILEDFLYVSNCSLTAFAGWLERYTKNSWRGERVEK